MVSVRYYPRLGYATLQMEENEVERLVRPCLTLRSLMGRGLFGLDPIILCHYTAQQDGGRESETAEDRSA